MARKHWLLSRKFWLAVITAATLILRDQIGLDLEPATIVAAILPVIIYIGGEAWIDSQHSL